MIYFSYNFREQNSLLLGEAALASALNPRRADRQAEYWAGNGIESYQLRNCPVIDTQNCKALDSPTTPFVRIVSWVRLDNRNELRQQLAVDNDIPATATDSELICLAWKKWREECVQHLLGDFSFVLYDSDDGSIFCARDHFGVRPLFIREVEGGFVCSTSMAPIKRVQPNQLTINNPWLVDYISDLSMSFNSTAYDQIKKLPPGHSLSIKKGKLKLRQYYSLSVSSPASYPDYQGYLDCFQQKVIGAVSNRLGPNEAIGCELSGGLDSAGISGIANQLLLAENKLPHIFSFIVFEKEPERIQAVLNKLRYPPTFMVGWNVLSRKHLQRMNEGAEQIGQPIEHESATFHTPFYAHAEQVGVNVLLSGFGGDELVTSQHSRLILTNLLKHRNYKELLTCLPGNLAFRYLRMAKLLGREWHGRFSNGKKYKSSILKAIEQYWQSSIINETVASRYQVKDRVFSNAEFDADYDDLHQFLVERRWQPFIPTRMESCSILAANYGVEYRWPLLDKRLVESYLSFPAHLNLQNGVARNLYRQAVKPYIPAPVYSSHPKQMGQTIVPLKDNLLMNSLVTFENLHPLLQEIVEKDKYNRLVNMLKESDANANFRLYNERIIRKTVHLHDWLLKNS